MNCGGQWCAFNNEGRLMRVHEKSMEKEFTILEDDKHVSPFATRKQGIHAHAVLPANRKWAEPHCSPIAGAN